MPPRKKRTEPEECGNCFGCGHTCGLCDYPINACSCDLDTEEIVTCPDCDGTGRLEAETPRVTALA